MGNHPNRNKNSASANPSPDQIFQSREDAGLTQKEAGALLYTSAEVWANWESGRRRMHPAFWELFRIKAHE